MWIQGPTCMTTFKNFLLGGKGICVKGFLEEMEDFEGVLKKEWYREDLKKLTAEIKEHESLLRLKRRWLMDLPLSVSEHKRIKKLLSPNDKILPESLLRKDDVTYEEIRTFIEIGFGARSCEKEPHCVQENEQGLISRDDLKDIFRLLNDMTNKGLCSFVKILTGGVVKFEKANWSMKRRIQELLPKVVADKSDISKMKLKQLVQLLKDPKKFHGNQMVQSTTSEAYRAAALNVLDGLGDFPLRAVRAMHRKLRGVRGYIPSIQTPKSGWKRDSLISLVKKMCMEMLSNLGDMDEPAEKLAGALGVAGLTLKLIMNHTAVIDFREFSPEIKALQSDIAKAIHLLDDSKRVSFIELKKVQPLLDPNCKLSDRSLRMAARNLLTEYLYECSDMDKVPDYLVEFLDIINRRAQIPSCRKQSSSEIHSSAQELMKEIIQKEVESVLNVSGQAKEVVLNLLPEHEFDEDFAHAYLEDFKGSDTLYVSNEEDEDIDDEQVGDISQHYEFHSYNSYGQAESIGETIPADQSPLSTSNEDDCSPHLSLDRRLNIPLGSMRITEMGLEETPSCKEPKVLDDEFVTRKEYPSGCSEAYCDSFEVKTKPNLSSLSQCAARNSSPNALKKEESTSCSIGTPEYVFSDFPVEELSTFSQQSRSVNKYLDVQEACDATSMLAYCSVGHMLYKLAKIEGLELYQGDRSYLRHYSSVPEDSEESPHTLTSKFLGMWKNMLKR